jgi:hypothetical protein
MLPRTRGLSIFISSRDFVTQSAPCVTKIQVYGVQDKQLCEKPKCYSPKHHTAVGGFIYFRRCNSACTPCEGLYVVCNMVWKWSAEKKQTDIKIPCHRRLIR